MNKTKQKERAPARRWRGEGWRMTACAIAWFAGAMLASAAEANAELDLTVTPNPITGTASCATDPNRQCQVVDTCCYCNPQTITYTYNCGTTLNPVTCYGSYCQMNCVQDSEMEDFYQCPWTGCPPGGTATEWQNRPVQKSFRLANRCNCPGSC